MVKYEIDPNHTNVGFSAKHLAVSTVRGHFSKFDGFFEGLRLGERVKARDLLRVQAALRERIDGLADPEEIVVKPLSAVLKSIGLYSGATVLGSGDLALILDPGSIASRAGVAIRVEEERPEIAADEDDDVLNGSRYLLVEAALRRAAVPLGDVLRIERIPLSRIEYIGYRPVLNFQGQLLPVEDSAGLLAEVNSDPDAQITVVVCRDRQRHVGVAVSHVLDVAAGDQLFEAGSQHRAAGVTLLKDQVTSIVNLSAVAALPGGSGGEQSQASDWNQFSETVA